MPLGAGSSSAATQARKKFIAGPATATSAMPRRGSRNFHADTGTGLAQPNMNTTRWMVSSWKISRKPGSRMVPTRSTWRSGLSDSRPACARGVVAQRQRRIAVRRLVQGDRQDRRDHRQGELKDDVGHASSRSRSAARAAPSSGRRRRAASARAAARRAAAASVSCGQRASKSAVGANRRCNTARRRSRPPAPAAPDRPARRPAPSSPDRRSPELLRSRSGRG